MRRLVQVMIDEVISTRTKDIDLSIYNGGTGNRARKGESVLLLNICLDQAVNTNV